MCTCLLICLIQYHTITVVDAAAIGGQCLFICTCKNAALFEEGCGLKGWQLLGFKLGNMEGEPSRSKMAVRTKRPTVHIL